MRTSCTNIILRCGGDYMITSKKEKENLKKELSKQDLEETTYQIRIFDNKTAAVCYKQLNRYELKSILEVLDKDGKLKFDGGF